MNMLPVSLDVLADALSAAMALSQEAGQTTSVLEQMRFADLLKDAG